MSENQSDPRLVVPIQLDVWKNFYEAGWAARHAFAEERILQGEKTPIRILRQLRSLERKNNISFNTFTGTIDLIPLVVPHGVEKGPAGTPTFWVSSLRGSRIVVPFYNSVTPYHEYIIDYIEETGPYDCIVELGCGYGKNLFEIYYGGGPRNIPYYGGEITESGRALACRLASLDTDFPAHFAAFDHTRPDVSFLPKVNRLFVFTCHSLEQVHLIGRGFFEAVSGAANHVTCLNFEPFGFQIDDRGEFSRLQRLFFERNGWNIDFAAQLMAARDDSLLAIEYLATALFLTTDPQNATSLAIWTSSRHQGI